MVEIQTGKQTNNDDYRGNYRSLVHRAASAAHIGIKRVQFEQSERQRRYFNCTQI